VSGAIEPPLATDGSRLFVATRDGQVHALGLADGKVAWRVRGRGRLAATTDGVVLREDSGRLRRLDAATGADLWRTNGEVEGTLPPVIAGNDVFVAGEGLAAFSLERGEKLFRVDGRMSGLPRAWGHWLFTVEESGAIRGRERASGAPRWSFPTGGAVKAPVFVDVPSEHLLAGTTDGRLIALRLAKGTARWRWKIGADVLEPGDVLGDTALFVSYDNILYGVGRGNGHLKWRGVLPSRAVSGPLVFGSAVLVACQETDIVAFDGRDGARLGSIQTAAEIRTAPLVVGDHLYVGLRDRSILAFALNLTPLGTATPRPSPTVAPTAAPSAKPAPSPSP
jgi:outer membrane protein assembly factor BamB